ncbi:MAG: HAMP domain-containing histidine kinase [Defluviitaleaceae bacterium]|nr:HAMP domain-containing histidine kinase [Defluviitaleaceae bacterium]
MFLRRKEAKLAAKIDGLLAGESIQMPAGLLEEKVWQVLRALEQSEQKNKAERESVLGLISDISHQIKTPLASLILHLDLAGDDPAFLIECKKQTEKINNLIDNLLKIARLETGFISVNKIFADLALTIREAVPPAEKNCAVELRLPDTLAIMHDPVWTREAFGNIFDNAFKYTHNGTVTVSLEQGPIYTRADISDTGIGIAQEDHAKIFARFYRVRGAETQRTAGTGLGLTIAREIMRRQGGNITVSSELGKGSTFSLFFQNR